MSARLVECVPNFSEGRDKSVIDAIARAVSGTAGVSLLDVDPGADTNRTVYTFVGEPEAVAEAALAAARTAYGLIDMARHSGAHPRMGALDVCPFVPVSGVSMDDCVQLSRRVGAALAEALEVPVYLYESSATRSERVSLADIRSGEYEALGAKLARPEWAPDFGPAAFVPRWGATVVGAREFLIAYNVNLNTRDKRLANEVALAVREQGRVAKDAEGRTLKDASGEPVRITGRLKAVRAIGWYIESYRCAQVSINLLNYKLTPLHLVFETVKEEAERLGLVATGSELVGLVPRDAMVAAGRHFLAKMGKSEGASERELVETAIRSMALGSVAPFDPHRKIVEYAAAPPRPLATMSLANFADETASDSPAPGGGSVAALVAGLGAALAAMVANLSVGRKGLETSRSELSDLAVEAQAVKARLLDAVDDDTAAFKLIIEAIKLPKADSAQAAAREEALQRAYLGAAAVPLRTAEAALEALRFCARAAARGNPASASDAGSGALAARAGLEGAVLNVLINLAQAEDSSEAAHMRERVRELSAEGERLEAEALGLVRASIGIVG
jgi:glutamate formiminotransferase/formiminotetrahydrofolate cyclodeaminase